MIRVFAVLLLVLSPTVAMSANSNVIKGAMGFMMGGDSGWTGAGVTDVKVDGCKVTYTGNAMGIPVVITRDLNKANYNSAKYEYSDGSTWFTVSGAEGIEVVEVQGGDDSQKSLLMLYGVYPGSKSEMSVKLSVTRDRFENALSDLAGECPGKRSKY